ncbi:GNAT family N-acetyltransferase [Phenylobacterium sp.]|jgi:ribosomal protein S18 acetylase RimI-like enzyme|uniref:GNAT family N-acetyltransferase n=1 Tax=Phenylobacterium sp. TaxID=1871053 RepID=UPI0025D74A36|nr:GNAT family N-acetyltransferase [Phenylobacterium sp.]MCA6285529.1 GNAT family N-acetyltransferase [Phenylobacterium sp.]MCA6289203.1 GNAT family N-acetyltransferase [Phenylobacterium sp.]MCA6309454.1 GNAT family N-acetyltransferase [Phenylobacterium sp.]MCA6323145.1 GNAT family N-acetyltransferase [Phenylobacterium sp.]MCA6337431.1 GNAT family N-acetyltransferase [Phenylobacterium sp.]
MNSVEIRQAQAADISVIAKLTRRAYAKWVLVLGREPLPMSADYEASFTHHRFDLAEIDGVPVGLIETLTVDGALLIENLAIAPEHQRRGLGSRLVAVAEELARSRGLTALTLYTNRRFTGNIELYQRLGFEVVGEESLEDGSTRVDMRKVI